MTAVFLGSGTGMAFATPGDDPAPTDNTTTDLGTAAGGVVQAGTGAVTSVLDGVLPTQKSNNGNNSASATNTQTGTIAGNNNKLNQSITNNFYLNSGKDRGRQSQNNEDPKKRDEHKRVCPDWQKHQAKDCPKKQGDKDCPDWLKKKHDKECPDAKKHDPRDCQKMKDEHKKKCSDWKKHEPKDCPSKDQGDDKNSDKGSDKGKDDTKNDNAKSSDTPKVESVSSPSSGSGDSVLGASTPDTSSTGGTGQVEATPVGSANTGDGSSQPTLAAASTGLGGDIALGGGIAAAALLGAYGVQMGRHRRVGSHRSR